jgi:AraC-like DNA-binding protein
MTHRFVSDAATGADMACANLAFGGGGHDPVSRALPAFVCLPLAELRSAGVVLDLLFEEAFTCRCGRQGVVDRQFEVVLVVVLRHQRDRRHLTAGPLAGLGHAQLAKALTAVHERPAQAWTLDTMAAVAGMSRSRYAEVFAQVVGQPPASYLAHYRVTLAKDALRRGGKLDRIAQDVGYGSAAALSRAFAAVCGCSPGQWRRMHRPQSVSSS